jgi:TolB-like protein/tetratricopeptide (TPR) repeat protein
MTMMALAIVYLVIDNYVFEDMALPVADTALEKSIAVLPFRNRSDNAADVHFVDGIHDDILTQLAKLATLDKVISRTSTERYRETDLPIPQIGEELGVATILEGGVQRAGSRVRINVQLIDTSTDEHLWAETYDHELTVENLFAIQNEISREIVMALHGVLSDEEAQRLQQMPTTSLEAHAEYAFGRRELPKRTGESVRKAQAHFEKAVELDPDYAGAWVGLAVAHTLRWEYLGESLESSYEAREAAVNKALEIDPLSGEAYAALAMLRFHQRQREEAEEHYLKAITLSPNYPTAYHWYAILLRTSGRFEDASARLRKAIELDPLAPVLRSTLATTLMLLGRRDEAEAEIIAGLRRNPEFPGFYGSMAGLYQAEGRMGEALRWVQAAAELNPTNMGVRNSECVLYLALGDDESAELCFDALEADIPDAIPGARAVLLESRGQYEEAAALLEALLDEGVSPIWKPGFAQLLFIAGKRDVVRALVEETNPELFGDEEWVPSGPQDLAPGIIAGSVLYTDGEIERANHLFDQALVAMQSMSRGGASGYGDIDALIHIARGHRQKATAALRAAFEAGKILTTFQYTSPAVGPMLDDPEWLALIAEIDAELARQREWYEAHKDEPLF